MDARRFRNHRAQPSDNFRWWGCVLLAMFALLQSEPSRPVSFPKPSVTHWPLPSPVVVRMSRTDPSPMPALRTRLCTKLNEPLH